jgi:predicted GIY-YIG superfamily endonuclease
MQQPNQTVLRDYHSLRDQMEERIEANTVKGASQTGLLEDRETPPPRKWVVYTLSCKLIDEDAARENARKRLGAWESWLESAYNHDSQYYVGKTNRPYERMKEHDGGDSGSVFTRVFPVHTIVDLEWYDDYAVAADRELELAEQLRGQGVFVPYANIKR